MTMSPAMSATTGTSATRRSIDAAFARRAPRSSKLELVNNRLVPNAMEPRAAIGDFDRTTGDYTLYTTSQNPHVIRLLMGAFVLHIPEHKLRVVAPDVGGGFGSKIFHYAEEAIVTWAAGKLGRPVKWTAERSESFMSDAHGRDHVTTAELALDAQGQLPRRCASRRSATWAPTSRTFAPCVPTYLYATLLAGVLQHAGDLRRGEGRLHQHRPGRRLSRRRAGRKRPSCWSAWSTSSAHDTGIDRVEIRRRNFIPADAFPYQTPVALQYDSGDYQTTLDAALKTADWAGFEARRAEAKARGKLRGIGISTYLEACGIAPSRRGGLARRPRRPLRGRQRPRPPDRQRHRLHRHPQPRPGA